MFKNNLKISWRNITANRLYASINLSGLAIGLASCLLIILYVTDELSYDSHFENANRIYRLSGSYDQGGDSRTISAFTQYQLAPIMAETFPEVEKFTRIDRITIPVRFGDQFFLEHHVFFGDPQFFEIFNWGILNGNPSDLLDGPNKVVISESIKEKYFAEKRAVGETFDFGSFSAIITGVMKDAPANTHFHPDFVVSMATVEDQYQSWILHNWGGTSHYTYLKLKEGADLSAVAAKATELANSKGNGEFVESYFLQPIRDIHLKSDIAGELEPNGSIDNVYIFSLIAVVILVIASINYINLTTAASLRRAKEIGIRKVMGAGKKGMIFQFQLESIMMVLAASVVALILAELFINVFNEITHKELPGSFFMNLRIIAGLAGVSLVVGGISGFFPISYLLRFDTTSTLKGGSLTTGKSKFNLRNALVVVQFTISIALIAGTLIVFRQLAFMQNKDLGIKPDEVIEVFLQTRDISAQFETFKTRLEGDPRFVHISGADSELSSRIGGWRQYKLPDREDEVSIPTKIVDPDIFRTLEAEILMGRDFSSYKPSDRNKAYIINQSAVEFLGLTDPVGQPFNGSIFDGQNWGSKEATIIGVVKDFNMASLREGVQPGVFSLLDEGTWPCTVLLAKVRPENRQQAISVLEDLWNEIAPHRPFLYEMMNEDIDLHYKAEERFFTVITIFSILGIFIGCLGLFGLSTFVVQRRIKEIGIRKVLGASVAGLVRVISWNFIVLVLWANLIAWPLTYFLMENWLNEFAFRIEINWTFFLAAGGLGVLVAFLTVSYHALRASLTNPVEALRYE